MLKRVWRAWCVLLFLLASPAIAAPPERIVAVGDLHGDAAVWHDIARAAGLIDLSGRWTGGRTTLVQLGDITDRGSGSLVIIRDLQALAPQARRAGGRVVVLLGNHEAMNVLGDLRYTDPGEFRAFAAPQSPAVRERWFAEHRDSIEAEARAAAGPAGATLTAEAIHAQWIARTPLGYAEHRRAWAPRGELGRWAAGLPAAIRIGGTLFVHGGLPMELSDLSLDTLNRRVAAAVAAGDQSDNSIISSPLSPLWYRGMVTRTGEDAAIIAAPQRPSIEVEIDRILAAYGAQRIVIAHTPHLGGIVIADGGKLVRVDTGNSRFYQGTPSFLEILGDRLIPHVVARSGGGG